MAHVMKILRDILFLFHWKWYCKFVKKLMSTLSLFLCLHFTCSKF